MAITDEDLLTWARAQLELVNLSETSNEVTFRAVISRSYYSVFHAARKKLGIGAVSGNAHQILIERFKEKNVRLGNQLGEFHKKRKDADYELGLSLALRDAKFAVNRAETFIKEIEGLP